MKRIWTVALIFLLLTSCSAGNISDETVSLTATATAVSETSKTLVAADGYTFEFSDSGDNYIITAAVSGKNLLFTVEDRYYNVSICADSIPDGFSPGIISPSNCLLLSNRFASAPRHDLLMVLFTDTSGEGTVVSKIYGIKDGVFMPLENYDNTAQTMQYTETIPESFLLPTEQNKFMSPPGVIYLESGGAVASVNTYTFDPNTMSFTKAHERTSADNPLYFGYAALAVCNDLYSYFTDKTLPVHSDNPIPVLTNTELEDTVFFFPVDDPRFSTMAEFEQYIRRFFSDEIAAEMFRSAPQKYRDINGVLCTAPVNAVKADGMGGVILTDFAVEDLNIVYSTEQFREANGVTELTNSGDFIIETLQSPAWRAVQYKYPYK
jgi:hypothetical protein